MDQNTQLKREYFELYRLLNRSNLHKNQKTEISFFIETEGNQLTLYTTTNKSYKIRLVLKTNTNKWQSCGFSGLVYLEIKICELFNLTDLEKLKTMNLTKLIKSFIFQHLDQH